MATILPASRDEAPVPPDRAAPPVRRLLLTWIAPALLLIAWWSAPLAVGERTLFLRDTLKAHLGMRAFLGEALRRGELPLIDPLRAGGQGLLGNPNALPLYPDNLLLLVGSSLWQLNAHFWLHWFVAFGAAFWLGRSWGLGREGAAAAGSAYAFSGFFLSQFNLYNGIAPVALAPALAAALLACARPERRRWALPTFGLLWALELVGGDPIVAAFALAATVVLALAFRREIPWLRAALALAAGTLLAAPQWVETARLLPASFRGFWVSRTGGGGDRNPQPEALLDLLMPLFFGRPDASRFWGADAFGGLPPLYFSLAPGLLAIAALAVAVRRDERARGRLPLVALVVAGLTLAFSGGLGVRLLAGVPGGGLFRFACKLFLFAALGAALLAGRGLERAMADEVDRRRLAHAALVLAALAGGLVLLFTFAPAALDEPFRRLFAPALAAGDLPAQRAEWARVASIQLAVAFGGWLLARRLRGAPFAAGALWVALHAISQLWLLGPMLPTDEAALYQRRPPLVDRLPPEAVLVHGAFGDLFGRGLMEGANGVAAAERSAHLQLFSDSGLLAGRRYEFNVSPEGLDSFLVQSIGLGARFLDDAGRVQLLKATGVDRLLLPRPLAAEAESGARLELLPTADAPCYVYRLPNALEEAQLLGTVRFAPHVGAAFDAVRRAEFDPRTEAVLAGDGAPTSRPRGRVLQLASAAESIEVEAESAAGGVLVVRRAWLPIWRVAVDGAPAAAVVANGTRLAVELSPGRHAVRFWIDRGPLRYALGASALGLLLLVLLVFRAGERRGRPDPVPS